MAAIRTEGEVPHKIKDTPKARKRNTRRPSCGYTKASSVNLPDNGVFGTRESWEYFVDALNDPDLILRVRERDPKSLDEALRVAQKLELWKKD